MTTQGAGADIAGRFSDFYRRQIAWLRESIGALDAILAASNEPDYDRWSAEDTARARRLNDLLAEFFALKKEWDATRTVATSEHEAIRDLVREVDILRADFEERRAAVGDRLASALHVLKDEAGDLRRGRENARKYGTGEADGGAIVDRRA